MPENQRTIELGKDLLRSSSPNPCSSKVSLGAYVVVWGWGWGVELCVLLVWVFLISNAGPFNEKTFNI